ncbi:MAG: chromate transporter [Alphaproteobacteria bacterium]|mgnify:CR=1 FL=1|nr:chromate transporter [Alphaproteobacteria bacterium]
MIQDLGQLLFSFGKIGLFALGGGHSMLKLIEDECVHNRAWLTIEQFSVLTGVTFLFPGLTAVKLSALVGLKVAGVPGLIAGVAALNLPGLLLAVLFYGVIVERQHIPQVRKLVVGMQYGAVTLLAAALVTLVRPLAAQGLSWVAVGLSVALFVAVAVLNWSPFASIVVFVLACLVLL